MATKSRANLAEQVAALQELDRRACAQDPALFLTRHVQIEEPDGTVIPLRLWDFQRDAITAVHEQKAVIVLKARRLGLSWIVLAYALWLAIFHQGIRILILCKTGDDAAELLDRIRRMRDRIADTRSSAHVLAGVPPARKTRDAVTTLDVGASTIRALMGTPAAARSETAGLVILDEFAFQRGAGEIWRAVLPTVEGGGRLAVVSTGNGGQQSASVGAEFARQWSRAATGASAFAHLFFPWMARPDRDQAWKQRTIDDLGDIDRFRTEYPEIEEDAFTAPDTVLVYDPAGIDAAERKGREYDDLTAAGLMPPPAGGTVQLGIDWGLGSTHILPVWQLPGGGIYIPPGEIVSARGEPSALTLQALDMIATFGPPLDEARYDSAGAQQMQTFASVAPDTVGIYAVAFSKRKKHTVGFLRELFKRTAQGKEHRVIAISPRNRVLLDQLRGLKLDDRGEIVKENDHGPDALVAAAAPVAAMFPPTLPEDQQP